ncbi:uncharacterized protein LOC131435740 [Malaya genurostris]|uniref:uncharacterized protein LOC131435740 n=1 Tax=Malaya genurostris TaxID=325434 RepID=UPI0026F3FEB2|nr:uncharacterized protein LOC131435740 [Malaya genurostris]
MNNMAFLTHRSLQSTYHWISLRNIWFINMVAGHGKSTNVDAIDSFISELMENKSLKWKVINDSKQQLLPRKAVEATEPVVSIPRKSQFRLTQIYDDLTSNPIVINIDQLEQYHIDNLVETAIKERNKKDVNLLFDQMNQYRKIPSKEVLCMLLEYLANDTDRVRLQLLMALCREVIPDFVTNSSNLLHYNGLLLWKNGSSLQSLNCFKESLRVCDSDTKLIINRMLIDVVDETIGKKSEAVLLAVIEVGEFCLQDLNDEFLLCYSWEKSFRSQWFSDQEVAKKLFDKHKKLRDAVAKRLPKICFICLQEFKTEQVYQLMELFLKHEMMPQCRQVLIRLFEYQYYRRDLRACSEIIRNSIELDIPLPDVCNRKLLNLLLGPAYHKSPTQTSVPKQKDKLKVKNYELKF